MSIHLFLHFVSFESELKPPTTNFFQNENWMDLFFDCRTICKRASAFVSLLLSVFFLFLDDDPHGCFFLSVFSCCCGLLFFCSCDDVMVMTILFSNNSKLQQVRNTHIHRERACEGWMDERNEHSRNHRGREELVDNLSEPLSSFCFVFSFFVCLSSCLSVRSSPLSPSHRLHHVQSPRGRQRTQLRYRHLQLEQKSESGTGGKGAEGTNNFRRRSSCSDNNNNRPTSSFVLLSRLRPLSSSSHSLPASPTAATAFHHRPRVHVPFHVLLASIAGLLFGFVLFCFVDCLLPCPLPCSACFNR